uniref:Glycosyltransferase n=1 Tax=viral metagenome TaxID=1070528 RepID=A0A6C0B8N3_9ZZZZ
MKFLHLTFHKGCELEIEYVFNKLGHDVTVMRFDDGETDPIGRNNIQSKIYEITHDRAEKSWLKYKDYYESFDAIITSDTCPVSRTFLQHGWSKPLLIWICNRFDYAILPEKYDPEFYALLRDIANRPNVRIFGNATIENIYSRQIKGVDVGDFIIKPIGKNMQSATLTKTYGDEDRNIFYIPPYHNETKLMNLSEKLTSLGIENRCERFADHISELLEYKGSICIPYAWSTIVFFERLQLGIVTFVPTPQFLIDLFKTGNWWFQPPFNIQHPETLVISEWYCPEHADLFVFFDSWSDLQEKINTTDYEAKTNIILDFARKHETESLERWSNVISSVINK